MIIQIKNKEFSKSSKNFRPYTHTEEKTQQRGTIRSSLQQKIDKLKKPVYDRKKIQRKSILNRDGSEKPKTATYYSTHQNEHHQKIKQEQVQLKGRYCYRSNHRKKSYQSWFRKTTTNLQETKTKKNILDVVILQKEIQRDAMPLFEKNSSMINLREKTSKSLNGSDSQSLLRKNSLYLLNFIKRKEYKKNQEPHIGGIPNLAQNIPIIYSPVKIIKYVPSKHEPRKRAQKIIPTFSKIISNMPIDPW